MHKLIALTLLVASSFAARAEDSAAVETAESPAAACEAEIATAPSFWMKAKAKHYWLAHTRESLRAALRTPARRRAFNRRELEFEKVMTARMTENQTLRTHAKNDELAAKAVDVRLDLVVIQNAKRFLYVRGHGLRQIPAGWAVLVGADHLVETALDPSGAERWPPEDPLSITYW